MNVWSENVASEQEAARVLYESLCLAVLKCSPDG